MQQPKTSIEKTIRYMSFSSSKTLCVGSIDYSSKGSLDGKQLTWIRLRLLCDSDGHSLWNDSFTDIDDVRQTLVSNDIDIYNIVQHDANTFIALAKSSSINELNEWNPNGLNNGLCVRTFITIICDKSDMFGQDSCWPTTYMGNDSIYNWYNHLRRLKSN